MKLIPVDQIPKMNGYHKLQELIEEFTNGDAKIVKVEFSETDYKSPAVCRSCLAAAIKRSKRPVKVWRRGNEIRRVQGQVTHYRVRYGAGGPERRLPHKSDGSEVFHSGPGRPEAAGLVTGGGCVHVIQHRRPPLLWSISGRRSPRGYSRLQGSGDGDVADRPPDRVTGILLR